MCSGIEKKRLLFMICTYYSSFQIRSFKTKKFVENLPIINKTKTQQRGDKHIDGRTPSPRK